MSRDIDSIPFYRTGKDNDKNDEKVLIASYNVFHRKLYWGKTTTEEEKAEVLAQLEKKKYKNFTIWGINGDAVEVKGASLVEEEMKKAEEEIRKFEAEEAKKAKAKSRKKV